MLDLLFLVVILTLEPVHGIALLLALILSMVKLIFKVLDSAFHVPGPGGDLRLILDLIFADFCFRLCFGLMNDSHELFLFQRDPFPLKFENFELFPVFSPQVDKLGLSVFECLGLVLELLVDGHDLFEISLHTLLVLL